MIEDHRRGTVCVSLFASLLVILQIDKDKLQDMYRKINGINNNVNQMKLRVTKNDDIYLKDFQEIEEKIYAIWRIDMFIRRLAVHVPSEGS